MLHFFDFLKFAKFEIFKDTLASDSTVFDFIVDKNGLYGVCSYVQISGDVISDDVIFISRI